MGRLTTYYSGDILSSLMINTILLWHGRSFIFRDKIVQTFNAVFVRYVHHCDGRQRYGVGRAGANLVKVTDYNDLLINDSQLTDKTIVIFKKEHINLTKLPPRQQLTSLRFERRNAVRITRKQNTLNIKMSDQNAFRPSHPPPPLPIQP